MDIPQVPVLRGKGLSEDAETREMVRMVVRTVLLEWWNMLVADLDGG